MSLDIIPKHVVKVYDPRIHLKHDIDYAAIRGPASGGNTFQEFTASAYSQSGATFAINTPSANTIVSRKMFIKMPVTVTATATANPVFTLNADAFRAFPIASITNNLQLQLNNQSWNIPMSDIISAASRYQMESSLLARDLSETPNYPDQSQEYSELFAYERNPMKPYADGSPQEIEPRGGFPLTTYSDSAANTGTITATVTEPLFLSPLVFGHRESKGLIGIQTINATFNWLQDLGRMWSHDNSNDAAGFTGLTITLGQPSLLVEFLSPPDGMEIPRQIDYPLFNIQMFKSQVDAIAANTAATAISASISLQTIPARLYIYAKRSVATQHYYTTDSFVAIESIQVNFMNKSGLLSSASKRQLYEMSVKNGLTQSWNEWSGERSYFLATPTDYVAPTAGPLCIVPAIDLGTTPDTTSGVLGQFNLQVTVGLKNYGRNSITPELFVVAVNEGIMTVDVVNGTILQQIGVLAPADIALAIESPHVDYEDVAYVYGGGSFLSSLRDAFKSVYSTGKKAVSKGISLARDVAPYVQKGLEYAKQVEPYLKEAELLAAAGYGTKKGAKHRLQHMSHAQLQKAARKAAATRKRNRGGILVGGSMEEDNIESGEDSENYDVPSGGAFMSRSELKSRLV